MIKFFRTLRREFMVQQKTAKYFKYALGEIVLVVIGILIALQINNWNEQRKVLAEEQRALVNIQQDFLKSKELLSKVTEDTQLAIESGLKILNHTGKKVKPTTEEELNDLLNKVFNSSPYYAQNGFLDDLIGAGKLSIIKNTELRNLLSSWKPRLEILNQKFEDLVEEESLLNNFILDHGSWLNADQVSTLKRNVKFPTSGFEIDNRTMLELLKFENLVENYVIASDNYQLDQQPTAELLDTILAVLEKELKEKE